MKRRPKSRLTRKQWATLAKKMERANFRSRSTLEVYYRGYDRAKDRAIEKAAGRDIEGSGMMLASSLRDLRFEFKTEFAALAAARRIKDTVRGVRCMLHTSKRV